MSRGGMARAPAAIREALLRPGHRALPSGPLLSMLASLTPPGGGPGGSVRMARHAGEASGTRAGRGANT